MHRSRAVTVWQALRRIQPDDAEAAAQLEALSPREREIAHAVALGKSNAAIAADLVIDLRTVESHIARIMTKLELHPTADEHRRVLAVLAWLRT